jgi:uncharacterized membrane protein
MNTEREQRLWAWLLGRFYRLLAGALGLGFGLLWAAFGLRKALLVAALAVLGWLLGKWLDEGGPDAGLRYWLRRLLG